MIRKEMKEMNKYEIIADTVVVFVVLIIIIVFIAVIIGGLTLIDSMSCHKTAEALGYKCSYDLLTGCIVEKPDGKKMLLKQLRDFDK